MTSLPGTAALAAAARASAASLRSASSSGALRAGSAVPRSATPVAASSSSSDASDRDDDDDNDRTPRPVPAADPATVLLATTPSPSPAASSGLSFPAAAVGSFRSTLSSLASRSWRGGRQGSSMSTVAATPSDVVASGGGKPTTHGILRLLRRSSKDAVRRSDGGEPIPVPGRVDEDDDADVEDDEATPPVGHGVRDHPTTSATPTPAPAKPWPIPTATGTKTVLTGSRVSLPDPTLDTADSSPSTLPSGHARQSSAESGAATLCATPCVPVPLARTPAHLAASDPNLPWPRPFSAPTPPVGWPHANDSPVPAGVRALDLPTPRSFLPGTPSASAAAAAAHFYSAGVFPISLTTLNSTTASSMATLHHRRTATADSTDGFTHLSGTSPSVAWSDAAGTPRSRTPASASAPASPSGLPAWTTTPRHVPRTTPRTPGMRSGRSTRSRRAATPSMHAVPPVPAVPTTTPASTSTTPAASPSDATPASTPPPPASHLLDWPATAAVAASGDEA
ncbi:hypothetical protein GGF32_009698 [Allomyces javanicus]|nr:hypothetical protein GGF32_009698 [Allomyces javanicus]